jgi:predicted alpha/beta superfamily hydrolase
LPSPSWPSWPDSPPGFLDGRRVWVYLPPGYNDDQSARYPVLYLLDGQNLFDTTTANAGEWKVDGVLEDLIRAGANVGSSSRSARVFC